MEAFHPRNFDRYQANLPYRAELSHPAAIAKNDPSAAVRSLADCIVEFAGQARGKFVLAAYGSHPQTRVRIAEVRQVENGPGAAEALIAAAASLAQIPGANVYVLP